MITHSGVRLSEAINHLYPVKTAAIAEAKHSPQYLFLMQKIPPVAINAPKTIGNTYGGKKGIPILIRGIISTTSTYVPRIINIMPAAFLILITYVTSSSW